MSDCPALLQLVSAAWLAAVFLPFWANQRRYFSAGPDQFAAGVAGQYIGNCDYTDQSVFYS